MGTARRKKIGLTIREGSKVYNLHDERWESLKKDITIKEWCEHVGHIRFGLNGKRYSFVTRYNKKQYEVIYA